MAVTLLGLFVFLVVRSPASDLFPDLGDDEAVARIELARGREQLVFLRRRDTGQWEIASAEDAPADPAKIADLVRRLAAIAPGPPVEAPATEPLALRLSDSEDRALAHAALWPGVIRVLPDGPAVATDFAAGDLAPARWSVLEAPRLPAIRRVLAPAAGGVAPLAGDAADALASALSNLSAEGWVPARTLNWAGAAYYQLETADGLVEAQVTATSEGRFVRLTAETLPDVRRARAFAFRLSGG